MLVASPSSQPRIAEARMIQTSEAFVSPKTQLSVTLRVFARISATRQTSVTIPTVGSRCAGVSGWHGAAGVILGLLTLALLVWELLGAFAPDVTKNMNLPEGLIGAGVAGLVAIFVLIKFLSANEFRHW